MANKLKFKRGLAAGIPNGDAAEPLFTTDTYDLYIGKGDGTNQRFQKYIASGATTQILRGDGSLYTFPLAISSPVAGQVLKYNGTSWTNDSDTDTGITTLNTLTATTQTFATGTSGTDFNISSATSTHTFNIPTASATNRGALSSADWTTFNSKIGGSGTSGQVAYFNGTSSITSESNLFWDATNDRLGIGTTSPALKLHSNNTGAGAAATSGTSQIGALRLSNGFNGIVLDFGFNTTSYSWIQATNSGNLSLNYDLVINPNGGNVGIGNTAPNSKLEVTGNVAIGSTTPAPTNGLLTAGDAGIGGSTSPLVAGSRTLEVTQTGDNFPAINISRTLGVSYTNVTWRLFLASNANLHFRQNSTDRLILNASGNLGLGITPSVWGSYRAIDIGIGGSIASTDFENVVINSNSYNTNNTGWRYKTTGYKAALYEQYAGVHIWSSAPTGTAGNAITFTQAMTLDASGRLGIGNTAPNSKLEVTGNVAIGTTTAAPTNGLRVQGEGVFNNNIIQSVGNSTLRLYGLATISSSASDTGVYTVGIGDQNASIRSYITFNQSWNGTFTDYLQKFTITKGGVGPIDWLNINNNGGATFVSTATATAFIPSGSSVPTNGMYLPSANTLGFAVNSVQRMTLDSVGRLGLGIASPTTNFHVYQSDGDGISEILIEAAGIANPRLTLKSGSASYESQIYYSTSLNIYNSDDNASRLILTRAGNLGLGVTPNAWRNIFNALQIGYTGAVYSIATGTAVEQVNLSSNYYQNSAGNELRIQAGFATRYQQASGEHRWSTAGTSTAGSGITFTQAMTLDASGQLGIGTTSPGASLHVAGAISATPTGSGVLMGLQGNYAVTHLNGSDGGLIDFSVSGTDSRGRIIYTNSTNAMGFGTFDGVIKMTLDASGNLGLGVTPSAWGTYLGFQIGSGSSIAGRNDGLPITLLSSNAFADGTNYRYIVNKPALQYVQDANGGTHWWNIASSGTAGNIITFTQAMTLNANGELLIGTTSDVGSYKLQVAGNAYMTDSVVIGGTSSTTGSLDVYKGVLGVSANARFKVSGDYADAYQFRILGISAGNFNATTYASIDNSGNGYFAGNLSVGLTSPQQVLHTAGNGVAFQRSSADAFGVALDIYKSRGTVASPANVANGDDIFGLRSVIYSNAYKYLNTITATVDGTFTAGQNPPTRLDFWTNAANGASTKQLTINSSGAATFSSSIQTGAPSGGTAKPWKLGEVTGGTGTHNNSIKVEVDGSIYYLMAYVV